ncbi:hypothetical protein WJX73_003362 [Symbiochloris irregularis]|uniref:Uncharacterized protein n=1 Tax=Symbiochloris irregularis TaxID=706552 RepID=A0AAW1NMJ2_9CHLO
MATGRFWNDYKFSEEEECTLRFDGVGFMPNNTEVVVLRQISGGSVRCDIIDIATAKISASTDFGRYTHGRAHLAPSGAFVWVQRKPWQTGFDVQKLPGGLIKCVSATQNAQIFTALQEAIWSGGLWEYPAARCLSPGGRYFVRERRHPRGDGQPEPDPDSEGMAISDMTDPPQPREVMPGHPLPLGEITFAADSPQMVVAYRQDTLFAAVYDLIKLEPCLVVRLDDGMPRFQLPVAFTDELGTMLHDTEPAAVILSEAFASHIPGLLDAASF